MSIDKSVEDVSVDNNNFVFRKASQIIKSEIDDVLTHTNKINDFTVGSVARTMVEAEALEIEKLYYYSLENLKQAIDEGVTTAFGFTRKKATYAYGNVLVRLTAPLPQDLIIDRGSLFYSTNPNYQQQYRTNVAYRIPKGSQSFTIAVYCTVIGTYGNIPENTINRSTDIGELVSVTNPEAFNTGTDEENPEAAKVRFRQMIQSLAMGTNQSLVYAAESVPNVAGASLFESTYGAVVIYAHDANGNLSRDLQQDIADRLVEYKPAGIKVFVMPTHKSVVTLDISVEVSDSTLVSDSFLDMIRQSMSDYINTLTVGDPLYRSNIIQKVMDVSDTGILDAQVDIKVYPDSEMLGEQTIDDDTIINVKGVLVNQPYLRPVDVTSNQTYGLLGIDNTKTKEQGGNTYKDALDPSNKALKALNDIDNEGNEYSRGIEVANIYKTNSNEILRLAVCNVYFNPQDPEEPIDGNSMANNNNNNTTTTNTTNTTDKTDNATYKTIIRTIYIHNINGNVDTINQSVSFMRYIVTDAQGNPTSYTDWEGDGNFDEYAIPQHEGFISQIGSKDTKIVPIQHVNPNDEGPIINVTYKQNPTASVNTGSNIE